MKDSSFCRSKGCSFYSFYSLPIKIIVLKTPLSFSNIGKKLSSARELESMARYTFENVCKVIESTQQTEVREPSTASVASSWFVRV